MLLRNNLKRLLTEHLNLNSVSIRFASKKASSSTKNPKNDGRPHHRGWKVQDGAYVAQGTLLVTQILPKFHPGLNVGFGRNGTLFAMEHGRVYVTCEKIEPDWDHKWVQKIYADRRGQTIYKKFYNIIPEPQHNRFKLIGEI